MSCCGWGWGFVRGGSACRYFETAEWEGVPPQWWYGGGTDITPSYVYDEDMKHFHGTYKKVCDNHDPEFYPRFRKWCAPLPCRPPA